MKRKKGNKQKQGTFKSTRIDADVAYRMYKEALDIDNKALLRNLSNQYETNGLSDVLENDNDRETLELLEQLANNMTEVPLSNTVGTLASICEAEDLKRLQDKAKQGSYNGAATILGRALETRSY